MTIIRNYSENFVFNPNMPNIYMFFFEDEDYACDYYEKNGEEC